MLHASAQVHPLIRIPLLTLITFSIHVWLPQTSVVADYWLSTRITTVYFRDGERLLLCNWDNLARVKQSLNFYTDLLLGDPCRSRDVDTDDII